MSDFKCPAGVSFVKELSGEYYLPIQFKSPPTILDIGACCGAFAVWASFRWPGARITCYEPIRANFDQLRENVWDLFSAGKVQAFKTAVVGDREKDINFMQMGKHNCGEASFYDLGDQTNELVDVTKMHAKDLPECDVLKIDTEGCELSILEAYRHKPQAIALEIHRRSDRDDIERLLTGRGYCLIQSSETWTDRWIDKYLLKPRK